ncbi:MAG: hypothetical protein LQ352_005359 [Teloschistes flavicans]|nr:MAG: hypothetical protein LQ352_005359 [Teloschistes flavicans]
MGKVHGSLARAGKVKSQTPKVINQLPLILLQSKTKREREKKTRSAVLHARKSLSTHCKKTTWLTHLALEQVEPQEKKKTPKGRAKKRITYTRRFVNVTMTGGKRKMNPNPTS